WASAAKAYARRIVSTSGGERYLPTSSKRCCGLRALGGAADAVPGEEAVAMCFGETRSQSLQPPRAYSFFLLIPNETQREQRHCLRRGNKVVNGNVLV